MLAGRYGLGDPIGRHGGVAVHHGFDTVLRRSVAIKLFLPDGAEATDVLLEARTAAGLSHPNIAQVYDYGDSPTPYLVMEFLDGETLADRLDRAGALPWREAAGVVADVAEALAFAHAQGLVHADVSPRTVMLTADGVKVLDFELAAAADPATDVDALGRLLFAGLTGAPASPGQPLPRFLGAPRELPRLYEALTSGEPPTAEAAAEALRRLTGPTPLTGFAPRTGFSPLAGLSPLAGFSPLARSARSGRSRRRAAVMASAAVVTAVLSILGVQLVNGTHTPGGKSAEAAVEDPPPATTTPHITSPAPSSAPAIVSVRKPVETSETHTRKRPRERTKPTPRPTTPSATPSSSPSATPKPSEPTSSHTPDETTPPTTPTTPPTSSTPETPPPANAQDVSLADGSA